MDFEECLKESAKEGDIRNSQRDILEQWRQSDSVPGHSVSFPRTVETVTQCCWTVTQFSKNSGDSHAVLLDRQTVFLEQWRQSDSLSRTLETVTHCSWTVRQVS